MYCGKEYYACNYCDRTNYRKHACSPECFAKIAWRINPNYRPSRTDLTAAQLEELMTTPLEVLKIQSLEELKEYADEIDELGFDGVMDIINKRLEDGI